MKDLLIVIIVCFSLLGLFYAIHNATVNQDSITTEILN